MKPRYFPSALTCMVAFLGSLPVLGAVTPKSTAPNTANQEIPRSVFAIPASPKEGRNPFFLNASQPAPSITPGQGVPASVFVLNGITSPPKRTVMINSRTFEPGETGEVRLANGSKVLIKVEEIRNDSVIISVDGKRMELKLRVGL